MADIQAGAASRPIAGKRGSHKYCTGPVWEITQPFGLRCRAEKRPRARRIPCMSDFSREAGAAVDGTGFAGFRG